MPRTLRGRRSDVRLDLALRDRLLEGLSPNRKTIFDYEHVWRPNPGPQTFLVQSEVMEIFYGGAMGGGKTDGLLGDWLDHALRNGFAARGVIFRRVAKNLEDLILRSHEIYPQTGAVWNGSNYSWRWPSGAVLRLRHLKTIQDALAYQGHAYSWIGFEELTQWPNPEPVDYMRSRLRTAYGARVEFRATGNPGGPGHQWVRDRYVSPAPDGYVELLDKRTGMTRMYVPAKLEDNPILTTNDPGYEHRMMGSTHPELAKAWRWGLWDIVAGGYFGDLLAGEAGRSVIVEPFPIPPSWTYRRSFDWGFAHPSSLGVWAVSDGTSPLVGPLAGRRVPRGSLIRVAELYTVSTDPETGLFKPNVGSKLSNEELGAAIYRLSRGRRFSGCVADPAIFASNGGDSIYSQIAAGYRRAAEAEDESSRLVMGAADNSRVSGWLQTRGMLKQATLPIAEAPAMWVFSTCTHWRRTVPVVGIDEANPNDVDTESEDHAADETRYAAMTASSTLRARVGRLSL